MGLALVRLLRFLERLADPVGPLGSILSPSVTFKERQGLPISSPHVQRVDLERTGQSQVAVALAPSRFVPAAEAIDVPASRVRQVSAFAEERWEPVHLKTDSTDMMEILRASETVIGWNVTQQPSASSRARNKMNSEDFREIVESLQIQASDEHLNGYYETIPGDDPVILDGQILKGEATYDENGRMTHDGTIRGGTMITGGRAEYREKTKGFIHWDKGGLEQREKAIAELNSRPVRNVRRAMESYAGELPMWKPTGINFRRDRRSAV